MWRKRKDLKNSGLVCSTSSEETKIDEPETEIKDKEDEKSKSNTKINSKRVLEDFDDSEYQKRKHAFIRSTIRTDYQPDICKDYKETGFCGFGDSCKFLHDRSDYKHGWQLDREYANGELDPEDPDQYLIRDDNDDEQNDNSLTHCPVCGNIFKNPIETKCKHYFCIDCAEKECNETCFTCKQATSGIFKNAKKILEAATKI